MFKEIFSSDLKNRAAAVLLQRLQDADCILWGLGRSLNKQKPGISDRVEMPSFVPLYIRTHCLPLVSGIRDNYYCTKLGIIDF